MPIGAFLRLGAAVLFFLWLSQIAVANDMAQRPSREDLKLLAEAISAVQGAYVDSVDGRVLLEGAMRGMLNGLDPDADLLSDRDWRDLQIGHLAGIGVDLGRYDGLLRVVSVFQNSPAARAGLQVGDVITIVDGVEVYGLATRDVLRRLLGASESEVTIAVLSRQGRKLNVRLKREVIKPRAVYGYRANVDFAYIQLSKFSDDTPAELAREINRLYAAGQLKGLVLDLRNNNGGVLNSAVGVASLFLPPGTLILSSEGRLADANHAYRAIPDDHMYRLVREPGLASVLQEIKSLPMIVMVNGNSVAASEIVAGALQDHRRAMVLGVPTYGRNSIQTVLPISQNRAVQFTTARWVTPIGRRIDKRGIVPDVVSEESPLPYLQGELPADRQLAEALRRLQQQ